MRVNFYATYRQMVGQKTVEFALPLGSPVRALLEEIKHRYPQVRQELLDAHGDLNSYVHVFVNGRDMPYLKDAYSTPLSEQDTIDIFPPVGGGGERGWVEIDREIRGMPLWLMRDYLVDLGGKAKSSDTVVGEGWQAHLEQLPDYTIGSLRVGQIHLIWRGEGPAAEKVLPELEKKLLRAGG